MAARADTGTAITSVMRTDVESYGYLDDLRYARDYIEYHIDSRSRNRIEQDLLRKGIDSTLIAEAFAELDLVFIVHNLL